MTDNKRLKQIAQMLANTMYEKVMHEGIIEEVFECNMEELNNMTRMLFTIKTLNAGMINAHNNGKYNKDELEILDSLNSLMLSLSELKGVFDDENTDR